MTRALQFLLPVAALLVGVCSLFYFWGQQSSTPVPLTDSTALTPAPHSTVGPASAPTALSSNPAPAASPAAHGAAATIRPTTLTHTGKRPQVASTGAPASGNAFTSRQSVARSGIGTRSAQSNLATESAPTAQALSSGATDQAGTVGQVTATSNPSPTVRAPTYPAVFAHNAAVANAAIATNTGTGDAQSNVAAQATSASPPVTQAEQLILDKINNDFVTAVGGANQDPNDPAYQLRWDAAQAASDAQYKKFFGGRAYVRRQIEAAQQAVIEQQAAAQP